MLFKFALGAGVVLALAYHFSAANSSRALPDTAELATQMSTQLRTQELAVEGDHLADINQLMILLELHNRVRANTLPVESLACNRSNSPALPLSLSAPLTRVAQKHADWMAHQDTLSHGASLSGRVKSEHYAYKRIAENIAKAQLPAEALLQLWLRNARHCKNILNPAYESIGIGKNGQYWSVVFGKPA